ncbi:copper chaperone PCu(A)C [Pseudoxanthomonas composti]|uniref:Copper chaperone PCu(A)C n=1 Tax=Pseudoxanthomonas composti TaxID=2137479 RepID=A0A4Q1JZB9_9GAMM|nr:copper chaperone PCu(A)C [Pseudoxanthomonas composti]
MRGPRSRHGIMMNLREDEAMCVTNLVRLSLLTLVLSACSGAPPSSAGVEVTDAWIRASPSPVLAGYLTLTQHGDRPDRLRAITSPRFGRIEMHQVSHEGGVMRMRALPEGVTLPPGERVRFAPGANHLMLFDAKPAVQAGETVPLTLRFEQAPPRTIQVAVRPAG